MSLIFVVRVAETDCKKAETKHRLRTLACGGMFDGEKRGWVTEKS